MPTTILAGICMTWLVAALVQGVWTEGVETSELDAKTLGTNEENSGLGFPEKLDGGRKLWLKF